MRDCSNRGEATGVRLSTLISIIRCGTRLTRVLDSDEREIPHVTEKLEALRAAHEEREHRLAANAEVERLLRG
jgi:hypothetical protein